MKARNLLTADKFTLAEAACMLIHPDPMVALMNHGGNAQDDVCEAIAELVIAIESEKLPCVELSEDVLRRSGNPGPWVYKATCRRRGLFNRGAHERRCRYGVSRADLVALADAHEYPAVALLIGDITRPGISSMAGRNRGRRKGAVTKRLENAERNRRIRELLAKGNSAVEVGAAEGLSVSQINRINKPQV